MASKSAKKLNKKEFNMSEFSEYLTDKTRLLWDLTEPLSKNKNKSALKVKMVIVVRIFAAIFISPLKQQI